MTSETPSNAATTKLHDLQQQCLRILRCTAKAMASTPGALRFVAGTSPWLEGLTAELGVQRLVVVRQHMRRHAVMRQNVLHTLATLHHKVLALGAFWNNPKIKPDRPTLRVAVARQRRHWFEGLWANAGEPVTLKQA